MITSVRRASRALCGADWQAPVGSRSPRKIPDGGLPHLMCGDRGPQAHGCALNFFAYNFIKFHRTLRMSPAWPLALRIGFWSVEDLVALWEFYEQRRAERAA